MGQSLLDYVFTTITLGCYSAVCILCRFILYIHYWGPTLNCLSIKWHWGI